MSDELKEIIIGILVLGMVLLLIILGIAIPCVIGSSINAQKEIKLKQLEIQGEISNEQ